MSELSTTESVLAPPGLEPVTVKTYPFNVGMSEKDFRERVAKIVWIKDHLMQDKVHYGHTPGIKKPSLYQPGAQMLNVIFQQAPSYVRQVERLDGDGGRREFLFNVDCVLTHYPTGAVVGAGMGGSCTAEKQWVKKASVDMYNTAMKLAAKRALVAATLTCVGVSEIWTQDVEDCPHLYRETEDDPEPLKPQPNGNGHSVPPVATVTLQGTVSGYEAREANGKTYHAVTIGDAKATIGEPKVYTDDAKLGQILKGLQGLSASVRSTPTKKPGLHRLVGIQAVSDPHADRLAKRQSAKARHENGSSGKPAETFAPHLDIPLCERTPYEDLQQRLLQADIAEYWVLKAVKRLGWASEDTQRLADLGPKGLGVLLVRWSDLLTAARQEEAGIQEEAAA
jgi:hypothetical protein